MFRQRDQTTVGLGTGIDVVAVHRVTDAEVVVTEETGEPVPEGEELRIIGFTPAVLEGLVRNLGDDPLARLDPVPELRHPGRALRGIGHDALRIGKAAQLEVEPSLECEVVDMIERVPVARRAWTEGIGRAPVEHGAHADDGPVGGCIGIEPVHELRFAAAVQDIADPREIADRPPCEPAGIILEVALNRTHAAGHDTAAAAAAAAAAATALRFAAREEQELGAGHASVSAAAST